MRLLVPLLALAALPACRTVYTGPPATRSLDEAVAHLAGRTVGVERFGGQRVWARRLVLTDSVLTYMPREGGPPVSVRRTDVRRLTTSAPQAASLAGGYVLLAAPSLAGAYAGLTENVGNWTVVGVAAGIALNAALNPLRLRVHYLAESPR